MESLFKNYEADENQMDELGNKCIHLVAKSGKPRMLDLLEANNALSNDQNLKMDTPLHIAAVFNNLDFITRYGNVIFKNLIIYNRILIFKTFVK